MATCVCVWEITRITTDRHNLLHKQEYYTQTTQVVKEGLKQELIHPKGIEFPQRKPHTKEAE